MNLLGLGRKYMILFKREDKIMMILMGAVGTSLGMVVSRWFLQKRYRREAKELIRLSDKHLEMFLVMDKWFQKELRGEGIAIYLRKNRFYNITIYGMGYIGKNLYEYLKKERFQIGNLIDQKNNESVDGNRIKTIDEEHAPTDVIIVTAVYYFEELENKLKTKFNKPILSFADIVYKM